MTDKREKIKTKVLFISASVILFHYSNGKIYDSSNLLNGLFEVEVTNVLIAGFIIIYLYYFVRFFVLREDYEFKNMKNKIVHYRKDNWFFRSHIRKKALTEINQLKPVENTLRHNSNKFRGAEMSIKSSHRVQVHDNISKSGQGKNTYTVAFLNKDVGLNGQYTVRINKYKEVFYTIISYPMYLFDDYFWETILPYITFAWSSYIILSYLIGFNEIIIVSK